MGKKMEEYNQDLYIQGKIKSVKIAAIIFLLITIIGFVYSIINIEIQGSQSSVYLPGWNIFFVFAFIISPITLLAWIVYAVKNDKYNKQRAEQGEIKSQTLRAGNMLERQPQTEQARVDKLKKLVRVSKSLKISQMADMLGLNVQELNDRIVDWADQFGFELDQDVVIFGAGKKDDFINALDGAFTDWGKKTETKEGKLE